MLVPSESYSRSTKSATCVIAVSSHTIWNQSESSRLYNPFCHLRIVFRGGNEEDGDISCNRNINIHGWTLVDH